MKADYEEIMNKLGAIVEEGSNENGSYIKYGTGTLVQYGAVSVTTNTVRSAGGLSYYSGSTEVDLPQAFINANFILVSNIEMANMNYFANSYLGILSKSRINISFASTGQNETRNIHWIAIGKWK